VEQTAAFTPLGYFWAAVLGVVQGVAEFLPISSSGHLALAEHLGMGAAAPAMFDILLHLATLTVVALYFRRTIFWYWKNDLRVLLYVVAASVPTGIVGFAFKDYLEALRTSPAMICVGLLVTAGALLIAALQRGAAYQLRDLGWTGAVAVGFCQALAIAPGISRSGSTIAGAMICGVDSEDAFSFSFILSIPAVLGAVLLSVLHAAGAEGAEGILAGVAVGPLVLGFLLAMGAGYVSLRVLEKVVAKGRLLYFSLYCAVAAVAGLIHFL
jgi:undecaprenyl-diphosphatase